MKFNEIIHPESIIDLTKKINIKNNENFITGNCVIIKNPENINEYLVNFRMVNYKIENEKCKPYYTNDKEIFISINKTIKLNKNFKIIHENESIIPTDYDLKNSNITIEKLIIGIEDLRMFTYKNNIHILGSKQNNNNLSIVNGTYVYKKNKLINTSFIKNTFNKQPIEKNWVYFINKFNQLKVIYKWYPLQICSINSSNELVLERIINMPKYFEDMRGSTCGLYYKNEIWFITHFQNMNHSGRYYHNFVVFDMNMKLKRFSKQFRFENSKIEFCLGFLITDDDKMVISYSIDDTNSKLGIYSMSTIQTFYWHTM